MAASAPKIIKAMLQKQSKSALLSMSGQKGEILCHQFSHDENLIKD